MPAPFQHSDLSTFMGSWPVVPEYVSGTAVFDPRIIEQHAVILGVKRETSAGFNVAGKSLYLWIDGLLVTFRKTINFNSYSDPYTLDQVISEINADAVKTVAFNDNGFLRLQSENTGENGYLKLGTFNDPDVFHELGLFSGISAVGGQIKQTQHVDPDRQVALPGQSAMNDGESIRADVINRSLHQLAINTDRTEGVIGRKRVSKQEEQVTASYTPTGTPDEEGTTVYDQVLTGDTQTQAALDRLFVVLDQDGREFTKKVTTVLTTDTATFTDAGDGRQVVAIGGSNFVPADETDETYVVSSDGTLPAALQGVPMKILEVESSTVAVIQPIDPATGDVILFTTGAVSADRVDYSAKRCRVDQVRTAQSGTRVEGVAEQKSPAAGTHTPTGVELNNRVVVSGATFLTDDVQVGDLATWASHGSTNPYSNNGDYRVGQIIDQETLVLVADDWGPAFLNPDLATPGTLVVTTDGAFYEDPFVRFLPEASGGAIPETGDYFSIIYLKMTDFRSATDDPAALAGGGVSYLHESDDTVQKAILAIIGPSATSIDSYLHDDARNSMENIDYRLDFEHYPSDILDAGTGDEARQGRHKDIRPDHINMWGGIAGETLTVRGDTGETTAVKAAVRDAAGVAHFTVAADGTVYTRYGSAANASYVKTDVAADLARIWAQANTTSGTARLDLLNGANVANPRHYSLKSFGTDLIVRVENDGSGAALDAMTIANDGIVSLYNRFNITLPTATGTAMNVAYNGGDALRMDVNSDGEVELWGVGDGYTGGGNIIIRGADAATAGEGGEAYLWSGEGNADYGGWTGIIAGDGDPGGDAGVYAGDALAGTDIDGGDVGIVAGKSTGSGYSVIELRAAVAGASGTTVRSDVAFLRCHGGTGLVYVDKPIRLWNTSGDQEIINSQSGSDFLIGSSAGASGVPGGDLFLNGGAAHTTSSNLAGGDAEVSGGQARGTGSSKVDLRAAIAGATGTGARDPVSFMTIDGATGLIVVNRNINMASNRQLTNWNPDYIGYDPQSSSPSAVAGVHFVDDEVNKLWGYNGQAWQRYVPQSHCDTTASSQTYTTQTPFSIYAMSANTLATRSTIRIRFAGYVTTNGTNNTIVPRFYKSGLADSLTLTVSSVGSFYGEVLITINTGGASGAYTMAGYVAFADGTVVTDSNPISSSTDMTPAWSVSLEAAATGSSTLRLDQYIVDIT